MHRYRLPRLLIALVCLTAGISALLGAQSNSDCLACHGDKGLTTERGGKTVQLYVSSQAFAASIHGSIECVSCHEGFNPGDIPHKKKITPVDCGACHADVGGAHAFHPQLSQALANHTEPDVLCSACHGTHAIVAVKSAPQKFSGAGLVATCGECHSDVTKNFAASAHGVALSTGEKGAPDCISCHRNRIADSGAPADSAVALKLHQEQLCLSCHQDNPAVSDRTSPTAKFIAQYANSVHGAALRKGNARAANCVDCHGSHEMKKGLEASATVNKIHIPATCAKCHAEIATVYNESVHGQALANGNLDAPACTNCHGEHNILKHNDPNSPVAPSNLSAQVCSPCHSSVTLSAKYGFESDRFKTFSDSYHGLAIRGGSVAVANCASCHGSHNIRKSSDPASTVNKANLAATCGKCHPGANERFAVGSVHVSMAEQQEPMLYWIATGYIILIIVTIGGMLGHNLLDFVRKSKRTLMIRRGLIAHERHGHSLYLRMTLNERLQHATLVVSFVTLVVTGFMLRFPEAWWVRMIRDISPAAFTVRSLVHRIAGVVMIGASGFHLYYILATERGRELVRDLLPTLQDATDAVAVMKYNLGFSPVKPKFGRFSYIEKSEYWALVWGTIVMGATGAIMWFDNTFIGILSKLGYDIARTVHYYEAWLATLAIVVWHFYFVIFNPDIYPINLAFWKGTLTEEEMADEHALELEAIRRRGEPVGHDKPAAH